ncbi:MAG: cupredoxin domain-containing protein [Actinomycetota bacterium]
MSACLGKRKGSVHKVLLGRSGGSATGTDAGRFHPDTLRLPAGKFVTIKLVHGAGSTHTFTIDALDCDSGLLAVGDVAFVSFKVPKGTTEFHCIPHGSGGMDGRIIGT